MGKPNKSIARLPAALRGPSVFIARLSAALRGLKAQQVHSPIASGPARAQRVYSPIVSGPARAESPTSPEPRATPWVPCPHSLRPVRAKVKVNRSPILLPLQGVGVYALIPRALPWAVNWLPFQGARGEGCGARCPCKGLIFRVGACPYLLRLIYEPRPCKGLISRILLRRQHCSSLCSQSEGHEYVANMICAPGHALVGISVLGRRNIRPPHFASKVSYSASPQTSVACRLAQKPRRNILRFSTPSLPPLLFLLQT